MGMHHALTAIVVCFSCSLPTASCSPGPHTAPELSEGPSSAGPIAVKDDGDPFGSDPDLGGSIGSEPPSWSPPSGDPDPDPDPGEPAAGCTSDCLEQCKEPV